MEEEKVQGEQLVMGRVDVQFSFNLYALIITLLLQNSFFFVAAVSTTVLTKSRFFPFVYLFSNGALFMPVKTTSQE